MENSEETTSVNNNAHRNSSNSHELEFEQEDADNSGNECNANGRIVTTGNEVSSNKNCSVSSTNVNQPEGFHTNLNNGIFQQHNNEYNHNHHNQRYQDIHQASLMPSASELPQSASFSHTPSNMSNTPSSPTSTFRSNGYDPCDQNQHSNLNGTPFTFPPNNLRKPSRRGQVNRYQNGIRNTPPRLQRKNNNNMIGGNAPFHHRYNNNNVSQYQMPSQEILDHSSNLISAKQCISSVLSLGQFSDLGKKKLLEYEFYPNWLNEQYDFELSKPEVEGMLSYLKNEDNETQLFETVEMRLSVFGMAPIISTNAQAFMKILLNDTSGADDCLAESNEMIQLCINSNMEIIPRDYISGLFYIIKGLKVIVGSVLETSGGFDTNGFLCTAVEDFNCLPTRAKAAVWASKLFFMKLLRNGGAFVYKDVNEFVFMDPEYYEWRMYNYLLFRDERRKRHGNESEPETEEIKAIQFAWNLAPKNPLIMMYLSLVTVECLRFQNFVNADRPLVVGQFQFATVEDASSFVKRQCVLALKSSNNCIKINLLASKILGLLPFETRDNSMARECIFQAYRLGQHTSSKANHALAMYMLTDVKTPVSNPILMCEAHLEKSFLLDKRNIEALFSLLKVYLSQSKDREPKIRMLFNIELHNTDLTKESKAKLYFLKGCFHMMIDESQVAINCWVTAYTIHQTGGLNFRMLQSLSYIFRVYCWPKEIMNLTNVIFETRNALQSLFATTAADSKFKRKTILMEIVELQQDALTSDIGYRPQQSTLGSEVLESLNHDFLELRDV